MLKIANFNKTICWTKHSYMQWRCAAHREKQQQRNTLATTHAQRLAPFAKTTYSKSTTQILTKAVAQRTHTHNNPINMSERNSRFRRQGKELKWPEIKRRICKKGKKVWLKRMQIDYAAKHNLQLPICCKNAAPEVIIVIDCALCVCRGTQLLLIWVT